MPSPAGEIEAIYIQYSMLLMYIACRKFRVPQEEAEGLVQDVFLSFIRNAERVHSIRPWLVAAICNASRHYWRLEGRKEPLSNGFDLFAPGSDRLVDDVALALTLRQALGCLQPRSRETLRLHYFEGLTAADIANELDTTPRYAEKLIHNSLRQVRDVYMTMMRRDVDRRTVGSHEPVQ